MEKIDYVPEWAKNAIIYHIYPIGFFGAPKYGKEEAFITERLTYIRKFYRHFKELGINIIQFGPIFESVSHGYDTIDYMKIDHRLGTIESFKQIIAELHDIGIKIIVDGVFNHVSREFDSFKDVITYQEKSWRKHWHFIYFSKNNPHNDGFDYRNWEGHYSLVKLNLCELDVKNYIFSVAEFWLKEIGIDGWRLDVAYLIDSEFWREFRHVCKSAKSNCLLIGEMIHGPYTKWIGPDLLDVGTGYQVYKSIWNAINTDNMYELKAVLERSFHQEWGLFKNIILMNFLGNHDSTRIRSILKDDKLLFAAFLFLFTTNGIPKIYYGDEIGMHGLKTNVSDDDVRKPMPISRENWPHMGIEIFQNIEKFIQLRKKNHALTHGILIPIHADDTTLAFIRRSSSQTLLIVINTSLETVKKTIPLWNLNLEGRKLTEILKQGGNEEYFVKNNHLHISELFSCWGRILHLN